MKRLIYIVIYFFVGWVVSLKAQDYLFTEIQSAGTLGKAFLFELSLIVFFFLFGILLGSLFPFHLELERQKIRLLILPLLFLGLIPIIPWIIEAVAGGFFAFGWTSSGDITRSFSSSAITVVGIILASIRPKAEDQQS